MKVTAKATRSGGWWAVEVPGVEGAFTQSRRLDQVPAMVADAVAVLLDVGPESVEVVVAPMTDWAAEVEAVAEAKRAAEIAAERASALMRKVSRELVEDGLTVRDAGTLLDVSPQRISQLVKN